MKAKLIQSVLLAAGFALTLPLLADDDQNLARNCDEMGPQKDDIGQDRKRDLRCAEPASSQVEESSLPVSGNMSRNRERTSNPAESPVAAPAPGGKGGR